MSPAENLEEARLLEAKSFEVEDGSTPSEGGGPPVRPFNRALVRWALHRTNGSTLTLVDLKQERVWQPVSWVILALFLLLFLLGIHRLQSNYEFSPYNGRYDAFFLGCLVAYTLLFLRGAFVFKTPCVFWVLILFYRCSGDQRSYFYEEFDSSEGEELPAEEKGEDECKEGR